MRAEVGLGARSVLSRPGPGRVLWAGPAAAWLRLPGGIAGIAGWSAPAGPLWARADLPWAQVRTGGLVTVRPGGDIEIGGARAGLGSARVWQGRLPGRLDDRTLRSASAALAAVRPSALEGDRRAVAAAAAVVAGDLFEAAARLGGYGPGLTPAGDDVLTGVLLALRARRGPSAEADLAAVAASVRTTDVAAAFLAWAALGEHVEPVHRLLLAAAVDDDLAARSAAADLEAFGCSSGTDIALGVRIGLAATVVAGV